MKSQMRLELRLAETDVGVKFDPGASFLQYIDRRLERIVF